MSVSIDVTYSYSTHGDEPVSSQQKIAHASLIALRAALGRRGMAHEDLYIVPSGQPPLRLSEMVNVLVGLPKPIEVSATSGAGAIGIEHAPVTDAMLVEYVRRHSSKILSHVRQGVGAAKLQRERSLVLLRGFDDSLALTGEEFETWWREYHLREISRAVYAGRGDPRARISRPQPVRADPRSLARSLPPQS